MIRTHVFKPNGEIKSISVDEIKISLKNKKNTVWVDIEEPEQQDYQNILKDIFNFHPLSIEDCMRPLELPKVDVFDEHIFIVFHNVSSDAEPGYFKKSEVDFFLGENYIVTVHLHKSRTIENLIEKIAGAKKKGKNGKNGNGKNKKLIAKTPDFLLYQILDNFIDRYFPILDYWDDGLEDMELDIIKNNAPNIILNRLMSVKREILNMRKSIIPQRDVLNKMSRLDFPFIRKKTTVYFKDVHDHIMLVYTELEIQRDLVNSAFEAHMSVVSNQMNTISSQTNQVMQKLTIITTIFMPLTFLTGLYGMNFEYLPGAAKPWGFFALLGFSLLLTILMIRFFKKQNWF